MHLRQSPSSKKEKIKQEAKKKLQRMQQQARSRSPKALTSSKASSIAKREYETLRDDGTDNPYFDQKSGQ